MADQIVVNPVQMLNLEREHHRRTIKLVRELLTRAQARDAGGGMTSQFCRLCETSPYGVSRQGYRDTCPCQSLPMYMAEEWERMSTTLRKNNAPSGGNTEQP